MSNPTPTNKTIDEALNGDELHLLIFKHLEEMLENPDEHGIYPTTKFMVDLKQALLTYIKEEVINTTIPVEYDDPIETPHILNRLRESQRNRLEQS